MADRPGDRPNGEEGGGYAVPPQFPAPPDAAKPARGAGPPQVLPEDRAAALWGPATEAPPEPDRWARGALPAGGTALLDRPTTARRPVVAAPVRPLPAAPAQSWDWERSHGLRNALIAAAAILLVGSLIAAIVVFRNRDDKQDLVEPPPATLPADVTLQPIAPTDATVASVPPSIVPVTPPTTAAPAPPTTPPATAAPTTRATTPPTTARPPTPTVTASPPYAGCPPCPTTTTTRPRTTTSSSTPTSNPNPNPG